MSRQGGVLVPAPLGFVKAMATVVPRLRKIPPVPDGGVQGGGYGRAGALLCWMDRRLQAKGTSGILSRSTGVARQGPRG